MKKLKNDSPPELEGHHKQSFIYLSLVVFAGFVLAAIAWQFGEVAMPIILPVFFILPLFFLGIMVQRTSSVKCPECKRKMNKMRTIEVVEPDKVFGRYSYTPWNIFCCEGCEKEWRVPAIAFNEGSSLSEKDYQKMIEQDAVSNG